MPIIGVLYNMPAVIYVNTDTEEITKQMLVTEEMKATGEVCDEDGTTLSGIIKSLEDVEAIRAQNKAILLASTQERSDGTLADMPGWDWA